MPPFGDQTLSSPNSSSPHPLPPRLRTHPNGQACRSPPVRTRHDCLPACCPLSILPPWAHSQPKTRPSSRIPDRACVAPTTWQGDMFAHARAGAAVPLLSQLRQSVSFHQPRAARPSPHISKSQFPEMLVQPHGPPLGLHVWQDRQCFRHAARPMPYAPDGECDRCSLAPANHGAPPSTLLATAAA